MVREILLIGNKNLYEVSEEVKIEELEYIKEVVEDLHDTLLEFREKFGYARAIAAPQIEVFKRVIYMFIDEPVVFINPILIFDGTDMLEVIDDCMSFPGLLVKVKRYKRCKIKYRDINWNEHELHLEGDLSELIQHEYDHLDGVLATMKMVDNKSLYVKQIIRCLGDKIDR